MASQASVLEQQLNGERSRSTPLGVLDHAARQVERDGRLDMEALAVHANVSRATLYRWVGNHERLLGEVFAIGATRLFREAADGATGTGADRVLSTLERFMRLISDHHAVCALRRDDPSLALRVLTATAASTRTQEAIERLIDEEHAQGRLELGRFTPEDLALVTLRGMQAFLFRELFTGRPADLTLAHITVRALIEGAGTSVGHE